MAAEIVQLETGQAKPDLPELGTPGTQFFAGVIRSDEYVPELAGSRALDVYERMRRGDGMVKAVLAAIKHPILSARWDLVPGSDDPRDREIRDRLARNLFEGMSMSWRDHLRQTLTYLDFGFYVCEVVWRVGDDGLYEVQKLAPRLQRTISKWDIADDGGLKGIVQRLWSGSQRSVPIPIDKLLVFTHEKEGANWEGTSVLRTAYRDWFLKDHKMRFQAIQAERHAIGIPVMELPEGKDDPKNVARAEDILMGIRTHERAFVVEPHGYKFRFEGAGDGRLLDLVPHLNYHDRQIALSVLAHHLSLGATPEGSNALSGDQSSFFMLAEKAIADHVADVHNRYLIPRWVAYNYGTVQRLPQLRTGRIETRGLEKIWNALATAAGQMLITPDDALEDALRADANLPPRDPATARARTAAAPPPQPQPEGQNPGTEPPPPPAPPSPTDPDEQEE